MDAATVPQDVLEVLRVNHIVELSQRIDRLTRAAVLAFTTRDAQRAESLLGQETSSFAGMDPAQWIGDPGDEIRIQDGRRAALARKLVVDVEALGSHALALCGQVRYLTARVEETTAVDHLAEIVPDIITEAMLAVSSPGSEDLSRTQAAMRRMEVAFAQSFPDLLLFACREPTRIDEVIRLCAVCRSLECLADGSWDIVQTARLFFGPGTKKALSGPAAADGEQRRVVP